jgi:hypothetical protein
MVGGVTFQGVWNASTNTPTLTSSVGTKGYYYIVDVAGSTNLNGITDWKIGDWAIFNGTTWDKVDNTDAVSSVNGFTGAVSLTTANISEVTNLYYTEGRVSANTDVAANTAARHNAVTIGTANGLSLSTQVLSLGLSSGSTTGALSSTDWTTFNGKFNLPSLTSGSVLFSNGSTIAQDNANFFWDDTNNRLGIGTASPAEKLSVKAADVAIKLEGATNSYLLQIVDSNNRLRIFDNTNNAERITLTSAGNVGIGTATPNIGSVTGTVLTINGSVQSNLEMASAGVSRARIASSSSDTTIETRTALPLVFGTNSTEKMRITSGGNLLIGTTTDNLSGAKLQVSGSATFSSSVTATSLIVNTSGQTRTITTFYELGSDGANIFMGGGGLSSGTGGGSSNLGSYNTSVGVNALLLNTTGGYNTAIGVTALRANTTGKNNTANGVSSLFYNTTGSGNTAIGLSALFSNETEGNNCALGFDAGNYIAGGISSNTITNNSIFIGVDTRAAANNQTNQIVIGYNETGLGSNTTIIGNSSTTLTALRGSIIIGATSANASAQLQVDSTTKGFLPPRMTTTQKNAIVSPAAGLIVYDTTLNKLCVRVASTWQTITSA